MEKLARNLVSLQALLFLGLAWVFLTVASPAFAAARLAPALQISTGILFIESDVADYQQLAAGAGPDLEVVLLDAREDGLHQMADALAGRNDISAIHLISHGAPGALALGSLTLDRWALQKRGAELARISKALRDDAELLLYGCEVGQGPEGQEFVAMLAGATGVKVAASTNLTGARELGGDWALESITGLLRSAALSYPDYLHVLQSVAGVATPNQPDGYDYGPTFIDSEGASPISNIEYEMFFSNNLITSGGNITSTVNSGGLGAVLAHFGSMQGFVIQSQGNQPFKLSSFVMQDAEGNNGNYTATGYANGYPVGTRNFTVPQANEFYTTVNLGSDFQDVTRVVITSAGGANGSVLFVEGFKSLTFADPVLSANNNLSLLVPSQGTLSPTFDVNTTNYAVAVGNAITSIKLTPTADDPAWAGITVNGVSVTSGTASGNIALNVGANTLTTIVTAHNGTTKTYTITVTRAAPPSSNANLSNLVLSVGTLNPAFASGTTAYTASVPFTTTSLTATPTVADATASVTVNGVAVTSGNASGAIALAVGTNTITTVVTAQDGTTTKTYTKTVTRSAASGNSQLGALSLSSGTLAPAFASGTTSYTASVSNATTSLTVTPTVADATASVTVNGVATTSGNASGAIALNVGSNTITVTVTAQNGTPQSYTVTVTRAASSNADLSALSLSSGTLAPAFAAGTTSYTASVSNATTSLTVTPTVAAGTSSVTVNGVATTSGNASGAIALAVGANTLTTVVTAQDGTTTKTYTVTVTRAASSNADLSALSLSSGTLSPVFAAGTTGYAASIAAGTSSLTVTPTAAAGTSSITVNGVAVTSGAASGAIAMNPGSNTVTIVVTAQNGATKSYTVTITRALPSGNADLSALSLSSGTLAPAFAAGTTSYTASVSNATTSLTVTPTVTDATASVTVNGVATTSGNASGAIALAVGANTLTTLVTAQDGTTTKTYTVTVTRAGSGDANLSALALSGGSISPAFAPSTTGYTMSIAAATTSITVTPTVNEPNATITVNGVAVASGNASGAIAMNTGANTVTVVVTAQNNSTTKTYTVTVARAISTNNDLAALALSSGTLNPVFSAAQQTYTATVPDASITVTPTVADSSASVKVNGVAITSGNASAPIALNVGNNFIAVQVTAQDGSPRAYIVTVTRSRPTTATGTSPGGGGTVNASLSGPVGCGFDRADFIPLTGAPASPPAGGTAGFVFSQGLFDVVVGGCPNGATVTVTLTYPQPFPPGAVYLKYGPTPSQNAPHWYPFAGATIAGTTVTLVLTDGVLGDDDLAQNGTIADPGGVALALAPGGATGIPTLSQWGVFLLSLLLAAAAGLNARRTKKLGAQPVRRA